jgi:hypothetical protein
MHQPLILLDKGREKRLISNIEKMLLSKDDAEAWNAKLMMRAYNNPAKYIKQLKKDGYEPKIILDFSGILLESLNDFDKEITVDGEKISKIINRLKEVFMKYPSNTEIAGTAYSHCYFPSTPEEDWLYQIEEWRNAFKKIFGNKCLERVKGFWLPEMGVPGFEDKLSKLIKTIKEFYDWFILPLQAVEGYEQLSYEQRINIVCQPHLLKVLNQSLPVVFRIPTDLIDQQAGCDVNCVYENIKKATSIFRKSSSKPALIVPTSDGENGNVMMNEFFPQTFVPFFKKKVDDKICSMTITEFLHKFYEKNNIISPDSEIKLKTIGSSWVGSHKFWLEGTKRQEIMDKIFQISREFHEIEGKIKNKEAEINDIKRLLLIAETSCYVYWGTEFWFGQGEELINLVHKKIEKLKV